MEQSTSQLILKGIPASPGRADGTVRIVAGHEDSDRFREGDVLVTRITDPSMVMMMARAGAIVCDIGGITSHPAIVSRELGIPCIVNTGQATTKLKEGMRVRVDGTAGTVYQLTENHNYEASIA